jgi:FHS family L-fucose permease-like MFS transporter
MATPAITTKPRATAPAARMDPHTARRGMFVLEDGRNVVFTFFLLVFLFALWGFCNGMIDVMDKHFQEELHLNLAQSAWVQFAHYLGYFLMAIPAGWLAIKLGYKGGIIAGLLMVAAGGFWFIPASHIAQFWAFLLGVCIIAAGLTFLETIANPYTTVLGPPQYAATRINLAQSINGIGLLLGPIAGGAFFYSKNASGISTGSERLWIPYAFIAVIVVILAIVFFFAPMPDIEMEDDYHVDESTPDTRRSIWSHPHFWMAVLAQFLYVAAQAGIFSFFINYITSQVPPIPISWHPPHAPASGFFAGWFETHRNGALGFSNKAASNLASLGFLCFLIGRFTGSAILKKFTPYKVLGWYSAAAVALCLLIFAKLGWVSVACVFLTYFFMSIMFPTIFALGIFGLGQSAKKASSFIVMAIMGGAVLPKVMGAVADRYDLSRGFIVPTLCFGFVAFYGFMWPRLSKAEGTVTVSTSGGH